MPNEIHRQKHTNVVNGCVTLFLNTLKNVDNTRIYDILIIGIPCLKTDHLLYSLVVYLLIYLGHFKPLFDRKVKGNEGTGGLPCQPGEVDKAKPIRNMYTKSNKI